MSSSPTLLTRPELIDLHPSPGDVCAAVGQGLARQPRQLPPWLLYDQQGSRLFEAICQQPEYHLTRLEKCLLQRHGSHIGHCCTEHSAAAPVTVVEFGAGGAHKVTPLLHALQPAAYVALDISATHVHTACIGLQALHPQVPMVAICCDYEQLPALPDHPLLAGQRLGFFPGSSLGNCSRAGAVALLRHMATLLGPGSLLLLGMDQPWSIPAMEAAYDDAAGVSARFARNLLLRLNRDLGANFQPRHFAYQARWDASEQRIEMALVSQREQVVSIPPLETVVHWASGERLITEHSHKWGPEDVRNLARQAGWRAVGRWCDTQDRFSLHLMEHGSLSQC
ncbi:MAG: L-histidine N(alpha)-methyltransferase [Synechococcus sp. SB0662_bin_45]|nr:L-histidine N(alpha)-methyltransferase [Synechococcus sp. SB0668_bin_13]MYE22019.1 L-histidine N(alpha)-methyltransferase [Synechococcus sp. SB0662_bin_45]